MLNRLLDVVLPPSCLACGSPGARFLCDACEASFPRITAACARCCRPLPQPARSCGDCRELRPAFRRARAVAIHAGSARDALVRFKLGGERRAARAIAARMAAAAGGLEGDAIAFVPPRPALVPSRIEEPAEVLARAVGAALGLPVRRLLLATRRWEDQAGLGRDQRRRNLDGAFVARAAPRCVLLVDDVMTTGATASACAAALRASGTPQVDVLTFTRAV